MKLAVIGGGSTYTPELADGIGPLVPQVTEFVLVDPDPSRLAAVGPVSARIMAAHGHPARVRWTGSLDEGADGADAILFQLRIGGQAARQRDETWPLDCGCVGQETTGAGGLAKALRTVPIVLDLAERAPSAGFALSFHHRLHQPGGDRHPGPAIRGATERSACATWPSGSSATSPRCSASHPTGYPSATSA